MLKTTTHRPDMKLVGITCRTNNKVIFESNPETNPIAKTVQRYFHQALFSQIKHRSKPGVTLCVYTDYESDHTGDYTYFIGEQVVHFDDQPNDFECLSIPTQNYIKFTDGPGPMPGVCVDMWKQIWMMSAEDFGSPRSYLADFEVYDERSADHTNVTLDIFIGVR